MNERVAWSTAELERSLGEVGSQLAWPEFSDLAPMVATRIRDARTRMARPWWERLGVRRPVLRPIFQPAWQRVAVAAVVLAAVLGGVVAVPAGRRAVAGWLGLRGEEITLVPTTSPVPLPTGLGAHLLLGARVTLEEAAGQVPFRIVQPHDSSLGAPDEVYMTIQSLGPQLFLVYRARPGLPPAVGTGVGLLFSEFQASVDAQFIQKSIGPGTEITAVTVNGEPGFWISGAPHEVVFVHDGEPVADEVRLAGNVLVWEHGDVTLRIESELSEQQALAIAKSVS